MFTLFIVHVLYLCTNYRILAVILRPKEQITADSHIKGHFEIKIFQNPSVVRQWTCSIMSI